MMKRYIIDFKYLDRLVRELMTDAAIGFVVLAVLILVMSALFLRLNPTLLRHLPKTPVRETAAEPQSLPHTSASSIPLQAVALKSISFQEPLQEIAPAQAVLLEPLTLVSPAPEVDEGNGEEIEPGDKHEADDHPPEGKGNPKKDKPDHNPKKI